MALWDDRTTIEESDWELAETIVDVHRRNRDLLRQTKIRADEAAYETKVTREVEREVRVSTAKETAMLASTIEFLRGKIKAGEKPSRKNLSGPKRAYFDEAKTMLEAEGIWPS